MKITIQVLIEGADALPLTVPIQTIDRPRERIEDVGLQTVEAKSILRGLQQIVVRHQLAEYLAGKRSCPHCQRSRAIKGYHPLRFRSAYGDVSLRSPHWHRCECERSTQATYCPLNDILTTDRKASGCIASSIRKPSRYGQLSTPRAVSGICRGSYNV
jgi:hypothetical protein